METTNLFDLGNMKKGMSGLEAEQTAYTKDDRLWTIGAKSGSALVRFLPFIDNEGKAHPYVTILEIGAKRTGEDGKLKYLILKSPKTIGLKCPVDEAIIYLKNEAAKGNKTAKEILENTGFSLRKRFYSNVLIRQDAQGGTAKGQIKIFAYGIQLKNKLEGFAMPNEEQVNLGITAKNVFDPLNGYDVILTKELNPANNIPNWDKTSVANDKTPASSKVASLDQYINLCRSGDIHDITKLKDVSQFPSYDAIEKRIKSWYPGIVERTIGGATSGYLQPTSAPATMVVNEASAPFDGAVSVNANTGTVDGSWLD